MLFNTNLPIEEVIPQIRKSLVAGRNIVIEAPPGAGKTTIVPLALMDEPWLKGRRIIVLEPRRLAARAAAYRMASLLNEDVGQRVGYRTRLDSKTGPSTRIEVVTEGILTRFLQNDPSLEGIGCVIFDEFHERSLHADLGLALALEAQPLLREDLRILVMSATLDGREISALLGGVPVIKSEGRAFPVTLRYLPEAARPARAEIRTSMTGPAFVSTVVKAVLRTLKEESGSILVFLPGGGEIRRVDAGLKEAGFLSEVDIVPLYGELPREMQDLAIRPSPLGRRKVVLATSIAETSLTIDGIRVVIDSGLMRVPRFSPSTGMGSLDTIRVTKTSAAQRSGRAGRLEPGISIRLWPESETITLREKNTPEIMEADLTQLALELAVWGAKDPEKLRWLDPPLAGGMSHARETLLYLEAVDQAGNATRHGGELSKLPLHPRLGHMVIKGKGLGLGTLACYLSAFLTERDIFRMRPEERDSDIRHRLEVLLGDKRDAPRDMDRAMCERVRAAATQLMKQLSIERKGRHEDVDKAGLLLAFAYPDRIARRRHDELGRYVLASGRGAYFPVPEPLSPEEYIVAANLSGGDKESAIFLAAPVKESEIESHFKEEITEADEIAWDRAEKCVSARRQKRLWSIVMSGAPLKNPDREKILNELLQGIRESGLEALPWNRETENLKARINFLSRMGKDAGSAFQELTDKWLLDNIEKWLAPRLEGMTRLENLKKLDLFSAILGMLKWEEREALDKLAPTHVTVPSGSRIAIDYSGNRPVLAVRLQEMFGLDRTPSIVNGKVHLLLHLLSPAGRPVQVTSDLAGFWEKSYPLVRKELKGRYPKHYWPDNPLEAEPRRGAKKVPR